MAKRNHRRVGIQSHQQPGRVWTIRIVHSLILTKLNVTHYPLPKPTTYRNPLCAPKPTMRHRNSLCAETHYPSPKSTIRRRNPLPPKSTTDKTHCRRKPLCAKMARSEHDPFELCVCSRLFTMLCNTVVCEDSVLSINSQNTVIWTK